MAVEREHHHGRDRREPVPTEELRFVLGEKRTVEVTANLSLVHVQIRTELHVPQNVHQTLELASLLQRVAEQQVGPGLEVVASQGVRSHPVLDDEFERVWRENVDRFGFEPGSCGADLDTGRLRTRDVDADEEFEFSAHVLLGFVADSSSTVRATAPSALAALRRTGLDEESIATLQEI